MRFAIFGNHRNSYVKPLAEGLQRSLSNLGIPADLFYDGHYMIESGGRKFERLARDLVKAFMSRSLVDVRETFRTFGRNFKRVFDVIRTLRNYDVLIVVGAMPTAFYRDVFTNIEKIRRNLAIPIVLYDVIYLGTRGPWYSRIKEAYFLMGIEMRCVILSTCAGKHKFTTVCMKSMNC